MWRAEVLDRNVSCCQKFITGSGLEEKLYVPRLHLELSQASTTALGKIPFLWVSGVVVVTKLRIRVKQVEPRECLSITETERQLVKRSDSPAYRCHRRYQRYERLRHHSQEGAARSDVHVAVRSSQGESHLLDSPILMWSV